MATKKTLKRKPKPKKPTIEKATVEKVEVETTVEKVEVEVEVEVETTVEKVEAKAIVEEVKLGPPTMTADKKKATTPQPEPLSNSWHGFTPDDIVITTAPIIRMNKVIGTHSITVINKKTGKKSIQLVRTDYRSALKKALSETK